MHRDPQDVHAHVPNDIELTLGALQMLHVGEPHLRFRLDPWEFVCIGDILIVAGNEESLDPIRGTFGPWIVSNLHETRRLLIELGAEITQDIVDVPTGRMLYARHPDGMVVEYVEWKFELVERLILAPQRLGKTSSQL